jgi:hypothetical protein
MRVAMIIATILASLKVLSRANPSLLECDNEYFISDDQAKNQPLINAIKNTNLTFATSIWEMSFLDLTMI